MSAKNLDKLLNSGSQELEDSRREKSVFERASSSTETLSAEERHTLKHTQRQEPQGEEQGCRISGFVQKSSTSTFLNRPSEDHAVISSATSSRNLESNLSISSGTNTNTLIIHHSVPDQSLSHQWLSGYTPVTKPLRERSLQPTGSDLTTFITRVNSKFSETLTTSNSFLQSNSSGLFSTSLLDSASGNLSASSSTLKTPLLLSSHNRMTSPSFSRTSSGKYCGAHTEILDIPSSYLEQSEVLKHLVSKEAKEQGKNFINGVNLSTFGHLGNISGGCSDQSASSSNSAINIFHNERGSVSGSSSQSSQHIINTLDHRDDPDIALLLNRLPPPPAYPPWQLENSLHTKEGVSEKALLSKSQPDLTRVGSLKDQTPLKETLESRFPVILPDDDSPSSLKELVDILTHENSALKVEVDICHRKVAKLQRFELEMAKVEEQYESLVKLCERREQLERLARHKLNAEVKRLNEQNNELKEHFEILNGQNMTSHSPGAEAPSEILSLKKELNKRDVIISQLVSQNKELSAIKERQEMELTAQRQTLNEQRTHIDILDSALTNAQTNVVKLEEEVRKKQNLVEQAGQLKRLLLSIKLAADRREQSERNLRQKLEMEILQLKSNAKMDQSSIENSELRRELREKDEKIMVLEGEVTKWEQRFLQESAMRQMAIEAASLPKDAKIAALERSSQDNERRISQAETDKMRHMDEVNNMNKKIIALENRNRNLESYNAEREAMIKALQKRYEEMENKGQSSSSLNPSKMETPTCSQAVIQESSKHQHSMSISNISSTSVFAAPPHRDEELGNHRLNSDLIQCRPSILASDNHRFYSKEPETKILQNHHSRSGSYCCYVSSPDQDELNIRKSGDKPVENPQPSQNPLLSSSYLIQDKKGIVETDSILSNDKKQVCFQLTENEQNKPKLQDCVYPSSNHFINVQSGAQTNPLITLTSVSNALDVPSTRGDPPPYFSQHQVLNFTSDSHSQQQQSPVKNLPSVCPPSHVRVQSVHQSQNQQQSQQIHCQPPQQVNQQSVTSNGNQSSLQSPPIPRVVAACQRPHPPNAFCRICLTVRRSHRQNAAAFVRRAHSSGYQHNRRSAPSPASSADSLDDAPSILERLKKEWEMGFLGPPANKKETCGTTKKSDGSKTLPHPLGTSQPTPSNEIKEKEKTNQEQQNQNYATSEKENESQGKKDVSHLDRALNRLSMKRSSNPFGQKNINTDNCKFSSDTGSHQQPTAANPNVKTSNSNNNPALAYNSGSIVTISSIDHNSCFSENGHKNVLEKSNIKYPDQINSSISSQFVKVNVPLSTHQPKEEKGDTKEPFVLDSSDRNNPNKN